MPDAITVDRERVAPTAPWCGVKLHVSKIMMLFRIFFGGIPVVKMDFLLVSLTPIKTGVHKTFRSSLPESAEKTPPKAGVNRHNSKINNKL